MGEGCGTSNCVSIVAKSSQCPSLSTAETGVDL